MLSGTAVPPPQLDEFFSVAEAPLRTSEFDEPAQIQSRSAKFLQNRK
jgi:hypothetical protein